MSATVLIVNPNAAGGKTGRRWAREREGLLDALGSFDARLTQGPGHATELARDAIKSGAELIVALGGDGTINEVVNGFFKDGVPLSPDTAFSILSAGTGGDFRKTLRTSMVLADAGRALKNAPTRMVDVGHLRFVGSDGDPAERCFINITSFGIGGLIDRYVNKSGKRFGGKLSFAMATLRAGAVYSNPDVRVSLDGGSARQGRIYNVAVANGRYFGGGMMVAPDAAIDDGLFDVVVLGDMSLSDVISSGLDIYSGKHLAHPKVTHSRARSVSATPVVDGAEILLDVDGEQPGRLPASFSILPRALKLKAAS